MPGEKGRKPAFEYDSLEEASISDKEHNDPPNKYV